MAKQTIKQRKALRSAAAKKGWDTRLSRRLVAMHERDAANTRAFALSEEALLNAGGNHTWRAVGFARMNESECATLASSPMPRHREMVPADIGCWKWGRDLNVRFEVQRLLAPPSLFQRIREWFA